MKSLLKYKKHFIGEIFMKSFDLGPFKDNYSELISFNQNNSFSQKFYTIITLIFTVFMLFHGNVIKIC